jgi:hypothetical protein
MPPVDVWGPAHRDQERIGGQFQWAVWRAGLDDLLAALLFDTRDLGPGMDGHAFHFQALLQDGGGFGFILQQDALQRFNQRDARAKPYKCLADFAANWPGANYDEMFGQGTQREDGFIGQASGLVQARDRRDGRVRASTNDESPGGQCLPIDGEAVGREESGLPEDDIHPLGAQMLRSVALFVHPVDHALHTVSNCPQVDRIQRGVQTKRTCCAYRSRHVGKMQQRFAGHAAGIETLPTQLVPIQQGHLRTQRRA